MDNPATVLFHDTGVVPSTAGAYVAVGRRALRHLVTIAALAVTLACVSGAQAAPERIDINTASVEQLTSLPGIGTAKAAAIVEERIRRPFSNIDDLERVKGIGPALVAGLRDRIEVGQSDSD